MTTRVLPLPCICALLIACGTGDDNKDIDKLRSIHNSAGKRFVRQCSMLPTSKRDCVEKAGNAANGLYERTVYLFSCGQRHVLRVQ